MHIVTPRASQWDCTKEELQKRIENNEGEAREGGRGESGGNCDTKGLCFRARVELDKYQKKEKY